MVHSLHVPSIMGSVVFLTCIRSAVHAQPRLLIIPSLIESWDQWPLLPASNQQSECESEIKAAVVVADWQNAIPRLTRLICSGGDLSIKTALFQLRVFFYIKTPNYITSDQLLPTSENIHPCQNKSYDKQRCLTQRTCRLRETPLIPTDLS